MDFKSQIHANLPILCIEGKNQGTVDSLNGEYIKVSKDDKGQYHWIPLTAIKSVDKSVNLKWTHQEIQSNRLSKEPTVETQKTS